MDAEGQLLLHVNGVLGGEQFASSSLKGYEFTATSVEHAPHRHEVLFYSDAAVFLDSLARFIAIALRSGDAAIVDISESHRDGLVLSLNAQGLDVDAAAQQG